MLTILSEVLLSLHQGAREQAANGFHDWALDRLKSVVPFDFALCGSGVHLAGRGPLALSLHAHCMPDADAARWEAQIHHFLRGGADGQVLAPYHTPSIKGVWCDIRTQTTHVMLLYRARKDDGFSAVHEALVESVMPHLVMAIKVNRMAEVRRALLPDCGEAFSAALVDDEGVLHLVERPFVQRLIDQWPDWRGPYLPPELWRELNDAGGYHGDLANFSVKAQGEGGLQLVLARRANGLDRLTVREKQVAGRYAGGESYREVATHLNISPATVRNHLSRVYGKLEVTSKHQLEDYLRDHGGQRERPFGPWRVKKG